VRDVGECVGIAMIDNVGDTLCTGARIVDDCAVAVDDVVDNDEDDEKAPEN